MARQLIETAIYLIQTQIKTNIAAALADIRTYRNDPIVTTESPREYFITYPYNVYRPPAVFIVGESIDFKKEARGANFIDATAKIHVAIVAEDRLPSLLTIKTWRYQAALSQILDQKRLTTTDNTFSITIIVQNAKFSEEYTDSTKKENPAALWRKGVMLECDVEFYESL